MSYPPDFLSLKRANPSNHHSGGYEFRTRLVADCKSTDHPKQSHPPTLLGQMLPMIHRTGKPTSVVPKGDCAVQVFIYSPAGNTPRDNSRCFILSDSSVAACHGACEIRTRGALSGAPSFQDDGLNLSPKAPSTLYTERGGFEPPVPFDTHCLANKTNRPLWQRSNKEMVRFELTVPARGRSFSKRVPSTTQPHLHRPWF